MDTTEYNAKYMAVITPRVPLWAVFYSYEDDNIYTLPVVAFGVLRERLDISPDVKAKRGTSEWLTFVPFVLTNMDIKPVTEILNFLELSESESREKWEFNEDIAFIRKQKESSNVSV